MAGVRRRKDRDTWVVDYRADGGRRVQVSVDENGNPFRNKRSAQDYLDSVVAEKRSGIHIPRPDALRLRDLPDLYLESERLRVNRGKITEAVLENKRRDLAKVLLCIDGNMKLPDLRPRHVLHGLVPALAKRGLSEKTVREVVNTLKHALSWAVTTDILAVNRLVDVKVEAAPPDEDIGDMLEPAIIESVIDAAPAHGDVLRVLAYTGLRRSELRALMVDALDFGRGVVKVLRAVKPLTGIGTTKSRAGKREIPMVPSARAVLLERFMAMPLPRNPKALVFPATSKSGVYTISDGSAWADALEAACRVVGAERLTLHKLRHYYASILIRQGFDKWRICELMGHSSISVTERVYKHWLKDDEQNKSDGDKLQEVIRRARERR